MLCIIGILFIAIIGSFVLEICSEAPPLVFIQFSDAQIGCPCTDSLGRTSTERFEKLIVALNSISDTFDFAVNAGDINVLDGAIEANWIIYSNLTNNATFEIFAVKGNHDGSSDNPFFEQYTGDKTQYYFEFRDIRFMFISGHEYPPFRGTEGVTFSPEQEQWIKQTKDDADSLSVWAVCHFPIKGKNGNYWNNSLSEEFTKDLLGYSCGHEDCNRYIDVEGGWIELNSYGLDPHSGPDGLYFEKVTIGRSYVKIEQYNADTMTLESTQTINAKTTLDITSTQPLTGLRAALGLILVAVLLTELKNKIKTPKINNKPQ
ncbi:MAG: hypothetical protein CW691_06885 [Candidatus Bathyarchaeum sp.]|nr:MAG: hypothetical protein CW691_06885 [Candidatus Bathyarchaeum sp.]